MSDKISKKALNAIRREKYKRKLHIGPNDRTASIVSHCASLAELENDLAKLEYIEHIKKLEAVAKAANNYVVAKRWDRVACCKKLENALKKAGY